MAIMNNPFSAIVEQHKQQMDQLKAQHTAQMEAQKAKLAQAQAQEQQHEAQQAAQEHQQAAAQAPVAGAPPGAGDAKPAGDPMQQAAQQAYQGLQAPADFANDAITGKKPMDQTLSAPPGAPLTTQPNPAQGLQALAQRLMQARSGNIRR